MCTHRWGRQGLQLTFPRGVRESLACFRAPHIPAHKRFASKHTDASYFPTRAGLLLRARPGSATLLYLAKAERFASISLSTFVL